MKISTQRVVMSTAALALFVFVFAAGAYVGYQRGWTGMNAVCGTVIQGSHAGRRVSILALHNKAIDILQGGDSASAESVLRFLAMGDAEVIRECKADQSCLSVMAQAPPEDSVLDAAIAAGKKFQRRN